VRNNKIERDIMSRKLKNQWKKKWAANERQVLHEIEKQSIGRNDGGKKAIYYIERPATLKKAE